MSSVDITIEYITTIGITVNILKILLQSQNIGIFRKPELYSYGFNLQIKPETLENTSLDFFLKIPDSDHIFYCFKRKSF